MIYLKLIRIKKVANIKRKITQTEDNDFWNHYCDIILLDG
jgi:hypothetical protein